MELLDREIKYLLNKVKIWRPKQESTANQTTDNKAERTVGENEEAPSDSDTTKDESADQTTDNTAEQQESVLEATDTTQEPLVLPESEEPRLSDEPVQEGAHQEL